MSADHQNRTTDVFSGISAAAERRSLLEPGTILNDRYRIEKELGRGGIGVVFLAHDQRLHNQPVVVKLLLERLGDSDDRAWFEKKFKDEIRALAQIDHPGVVRALDVGELADGRSYLVMQYVSGVDLRSLIRPAGMDLTRVAVLIRQIGHALSAAHQKGVLHRDLKPENIMLQTVDLDVFAKLIDFGMATVLDSPGSMKTTVVAGTVHYMAPEQMQGRPCVPSDIFAMGVIAYEMVTGYLPFNPRTPYELVEVQRGGVRSQPRVLRPALSEAAESAILRALAFDPHERYQSAAEFGDKLADVLTPSAEGEWARSQKLQHTGIELAHVLLVEVDGYARMSLEEQTRGVEHLQSVVRRTSEFQQSRATNQIISKTAAGGMSLIFFGANPLIAVRCAVEIANAVATSGLFKVRIGLHTGPVKLTLDINDRPNVSGDGINNAHRVMSCSEAGQVLMSRSVAEVLRHLSEWSPRLKDLGERRVYGGERLHVFSLDGGEGAKAKTSAVVALAKRTTRLPGVAVSAIVAMLALAAVAWVLWPRSSAVAELRPERKLTYSIIAQKDPGRYPDSKAAAVSDGMIFEAGDQIRLNVTGTPDGHLYIINEEPVQSNGLPKLTLLFPSTISNGGAANVKANQPIQIPSHADPEQAWLVFNEDGGTERLWMVWCAQSVSELEAVKGKANPHDRGTITDPAQVKAIVDYLAAHPTLNAEIQKGETSHETTFADRADVVVGLVKLEHRRK